MINEFIKLLILAYLCKTYGFWQISENEFLPKWTGEFSFLLGVRVDKTKNREMVLAWAVANPKKSLMEEFPNLRN